MTAVTDQPTTQPTREQVKRQLADAIAAEEAAKTLVDESWAVIQERQIPVDEFSAVLNADSRITPAHPTTWGRRKNRALGIKDYRSDDPSIQRRNRRTEDDDTDED